MNLPVFPPPFSFHSQITVITISANTCSVHVQFCEAAGWWLYILKHNQNLSFSFRSSNVLQRNLTEEDQPSTVATVYLRK